MENSEIVLCKIGKQDYQTKWSNGRVNGIINNHNQSEDSANVPSTSVGINQPTKRMKQSHKDHKFMQNCVLNMADFIRNAMKKKMGILYRKLVL